MIFTVYVFFSKAAAPVTTPSSLYSVFSVNRPARLNKIAHIKQGHSANEGSAENKDDFGERKERRRNKDDEN
jgi:hypothetical protein